ncbi:MAG: thiamine diphosphokinase [Anaerolineales bacterium]|jgi:thiamine pyrophosphokinase|nr:thiamine diphosphokinase [Anaerolineales bacterium]
MPRAILFANGEPPQPDFVRQLLRPDDILIAADGGARHAARLGLTPAIIIGDFDSLTAAELSQFSRAGARLERYPPAKDQTDLELALEQALSLGCAPILLIGAYGGRLDHALGILSLLSDPACIAAAARAEDGQTTAFFIDQQAEIEGAPGDSLSLIAWGRPAEGVTTSGLQYPLQAETLSPHRTRGISNVLTGSTATVRLTSGLLLCIHSRAERLIPKS